MKSLEFLIWCRDEVKCIPYSKEGDRCALPSNGELRRWLGKGCIECNGEVLNINSVVSFPVSSLVYFPKNKNSKCTIL